MSFKFKPIGLTDQSEFQKYLSECPQIASDFSFTNLWSWAPVYGLEWSFLDELIWVRQKIPAVKFWAPIGDWRKIKWHKYLDMNPELKTEIIRVPEMLAEILKSSVGDRATIIEDRDQWDYIYAADDLRNLSGNQFHKKKNLVNQFKKKYTYEYFEITSDIKDKARELQVDWCTWRECFSDTQLGNENQAVNNVLSGWESLDGITGGCIVVDGAIAAYTIGELILPDILVIHFEKGNTDFKGIYQAINQLFLLNQSSKVKWVNREQDLGDEGLQKAKLSYHPAKFLKKYRVKLV